MKYLAGLLFTYIIAAPLTSRISLDMTQTHWLDIMTYVIWMFGVVIWMAILMIIVIVINWWVS